MLKPGTAIIVFLFILIIFAAGLAQPAAQNKYWIFFKDKPETALTKTSVKLLAKQLEISERALKRRAKVIPENQVIGKHDYPVSRGYLQQLEKLGYQPIITSRWLNAASLLLTTDDVVKIKQLPFIKQVKPVAEFKLSPPPVDIHPGKTVLIKQAEHKYDYGASATQNEIINVPAVHDLGITAKGIRIGMLDSGFKYRGHEAFANTEIIAEYDFVNNDSLTENENGQDFSTQHNHGTQTLSVIGAFQEGQLIGMAFGASYLLAKTEYVPTETAIEEDFWVAGIEWLEMQGVDVVSSSVGYTDFYDQSDMDGNTAVVTKAADWAASLGVVVVNSAGNEGNTSWGAVIAPADGDSVIAVGGVDANNAIIGFSSRGPTADGRTKPDVVALGNTVWTALPSSNVDFSQYTYTSGTSFSCPAVAGVAALILAAHPDLTPIDVRDALRLTADKASSPNNDFGWGLVDAWQAILFHGPAFSQTVDILFVNNQKVEIKVKIASKNGIEPNQASLLYGSENSSFENEIGMNKTNIANEFVATLDEIPGLAPVKFYFRVADSNNVVALHPFNAPDSFFTIQSLPVDTGNGNPIPRIFTLAQNFPNPFNATTQIIFELKDTSAVRLEIFNVLGQKIKTLIDNEKLLAFRYGYTWDGRNDNGSAAVSGVYFYRLIAGNQTEVKKMLLIK